MPNPSRHRHPLLLSDVGPRRSEPPAFTNACPSTPGIAGKAGANRPNPSDCQHSSGASVARGAADALAMHRMLASATAAVLAADDEPFVLQGIEVGSPLRGEVLRCVAPSRRAGGHTAVTGAMTDVARGDA